MEPVSPGPDRAGQLSRQQQGAARERQARHLLQTSGLRFIAANVRYRRDGRFGGAAASITRSKQQKLLRAAALWLNGRGLSFDTADCRFDVVAITGEQVEWLPNAFTAE